MSTFKSVQDIMAQTAPEDAKPTRSPRMPSDAYVERARESYVRLVHCMDSYTSGVRADVNIRQPAVFEDLHALNLTHLSGMLYKDFIVLQSITSSNECQ